MRQALAETCRLLGDELEVSTTADFWNIPWSIAMAEVAPLTTLKLFIETIDKALIRRQIPILPANIPLTSSISSNSIGNIAEITQPEASIQVAERKLGWKSGQVIRSGDDTRTFYTRLDATNLLFTEVAHMPLTIPGWYNDFALRLVMTHTVHQGDNRVHLGISALLSGDADSQPLSYSRADVRRYITVTNAAGKEIRRINEEQRYSRGKLDEVRGHIDFQHVAQHSELIQYFDNVELPTKLMRNLTEMPTPKPGIVTNFLRQLGNRKRNARS